MKTFLLGAAAAGALLVPAAAMAQTAPVLIVDVDTVLTTCTACVAANGQLQAQGQTLQQRAQTLRTQLQTSGQPIQTAVNALQGKAPDAALQARINAFEAQQNSANQELQAGQQRLQSTQQNVARQIGVKMNEIADGILRQRGASVVMAKNTAMANADSIDITQQVLQQLNTQLPSVSVTPLPEQPGAAPVAPAAGTAPTPAAPARPTGRRPATR